MIAASTRRLIGDLFEYRDLGTVEVKGVSRPMQAWQVLRSSSSRYHAFRGELDWALRLDEDLLRLSRERDDSGGLVQGHFSTGRNLMFAGRFASSKSHPEEGFALYNPIAHNSLVPSLFRGRRDTRKSRVSATVSF